MSIRRMFFLLLGASLCLPLTACGKEAVSVETETAMAAASERAFPPGTAAPAAPEETLPPETPVSEPENEAFVVVTDYIPNIRVELKYAAQDNFTGQVIYDFQDAFLRYGTVKKLMAVQETLGEIGLGLKIWDGFRPVAAQFKLWEVCPDPAYVANPEKGYSNHSRGNTVDVTLVDKDGREIEMPTGFDDFSALADRDYSDCPETAAQNALLLQNMMEAYGFRGYFGEWWHFADEDTYPVEETFEPVVCSWFSADCEEFISLRLAPDTGAEVLAKIPVGGRFQVLGWYGKFALADYQGLRGYVLKDYICPVS